MSKIKLVLLPAFLLAAFCATAQKKEPKYKDGVAMEKGIKFGSLNLSTSARNAENESSLFAYYIEQQKSSLTVRFEGGYVIRENLALGAGFLYGFKKDYNTQKASDGTITDYKSYERDFAFRPFVKNFIPLGNGHRFYVVIPTELQIGYGSRVTESVTNDVLTRTFTSTNYLGIQMRPGLLAFIYENFGFEVNVGAFGLSSSRSKTSTTGQPDGQVKENDLSLRIDVLQLSLGFSLYFR